MKYLVILTILFMRTNAQIQIKSLNSSGILFESIANTVTYQKTWTIYTQVNLYQEDETLAFLSLIDGNIRGLCNMAGQQTNASCSYWHEEIKKTTSKIQSQIDAVNYFNINRRQKRAWFNIIGTGMKTLFGTMSQDDADDISSRLKTLEEHDKENLHMIQKHVTVVQSAFNSLNKAFTNITIQMNLFEERFERFSNKLVNEIRSLKKEFQTLHIHTEMNELLIFTLHLLQQIYTHLNEQFSILTSLQQHKLHPSIISAETLTKIQSEIANQTDALNLDFPTLTQIIRLDAEHLKDGILIRITFPVPSRDVYTLNKIYLFPIPTNQSNFIILDTKTEYLLNNTRKGFSIELTTTEFTSACQEILLNHFIPLHICRVTQPRQIGPFNTKCLPNLLTKASSKAIDCNYRILNQFPDILTKLVNKNSWLFSFQKTRTITAECTDENMHKTLIGNGIIILEEKCIYLLGNQELPFEGNTEFNLPIHQPELPRLPLFLLDRKINKTIEKDELEEVHFKSHHSLNSNLQEASQSLQEFNEELQRTEQNRENEKHKLVTYVNSGITSVTIGILILLTIIFLRYKKSSKQITTDIPLRTITVPIQTNVQIPAEYKKFKESPKLNHTNSKVAIIHDAKRINAKINTIPLPPPLPPNNALSTNNVPTKEKVRKLRENLNQSLESLN